MKYLIITYDDYFNIPYIKNYEDHLKRHGHSCDIILWDRSGQADDGVPNHLIFTEPDRRSKLGKLIPFFHWRQFVLKAMKAGQYDRLIVLTTLPAVLLADRLTGKYRGRYWFDVRDFTYEYIPFYKKVVARLVNRSMVTSISSEAFRNFLPDFPGLVLAHNITNDAFEAPHCTLTRDTSPIVIGFVGGIQYEKQNQQLLRQFCNLENFRIKYVGKPHLGCDLPGFCKENHIHNVEFGPVYRNEEKPAIYRSIDLINSIYGGGSQITQLALPNKLYDCILFKKPILVSKGTYLASIVEQYRLGLAVDIDNDPVVEMVQAFLDAFDPAAFDENCRRFLQKVKAETAVYQAALDQFCSGKDRV